MRSIEEMRERVVTTIRRDLAMPRHGVNVTAEQMQLMNLGGLVEQLPEDPAGDVTPNFDNSGNRYFVAGVSNPFSTTDVF